MQPPPVKQLGMTITYPLCDFEIPLSRATGIVQAHPTSWWSNFFRVHLVSSLIRGGAMVRGIAAGSGSPPSSAPGAWDPGGQSTVSISAPRRRRKLERVN
jgi:hypothetical protein